MKRNVETNDFASFEENTNDNTLNNDSSYYDESGFSGYKAKTSNTKLIIIGVIVVVILVVIYIVLKLITSAAKISNLDLDVKKVVYVEEKNDIKLSVSGSGKLDSTTYDISLDNDNIALDNSSLKGKSAKGSFTASKLGKTKIVVKASTKKNNITKEQDIFVCNRLDENSLVTDDIFLAVDNSKVLDINLGKNAECYTDIVYESSDDDIVIIDQYGTIIANKRGSANITVKNNDNKFVIKVIVE